MTTFLKIAGALLVTMTLSCSSVKTVMVINRTSIPLAFGPAFIVPACGESLIPVRAIFGPLESNAPWTSVLARDVPPDQTGTLTLLVLSGTQKVFPNEVPTRVLPPCEGRPSPELGIELVVETTRRASACDLLHRSECSG